MLKQGKELRPAAAPRVWPGLVPESILRSLAVLLVLSMTACGRQDAGGRGKAEPGVAGRSASTTTPETAPDAQPEYNQTGNGTTSQVITNARGQKGLSVKDRGTDPTATTEHNNDQALAQRVRVALSTGTTGTQGTYPSESLLNIGVTASNGVVTLTGAVGSESARHALDQYARGIEGVRDVIDQLQVSSTAPSSIPGQRAGRRADELPPNSPR